MIVLFIFVLFLPGQSYYETLSLNFRPPLVQATPFDTFEPSLYPNKTKNEAPPLVSAKSGVVRDMESGVVLWEKDPEIRLRPASITKLMTALVAVDFYRFDEVLQVRRLAPANGESEMGLRVGDRVSVENLIYGLLVPSGNDAAYTLADNYPGGIENFVYSMNNRATEMHMSNTHFANPSGLDDTNHHSSARDISLLTTMALRNPFISKVVATYGITLTDATGNKTYQMKNVNKFLGYLYGADGVKTGYTDLAGECLVASVSRANHRVVSVILNSQDRFNDSSRLLEWVYRNFQWKNLNEGSN